MEWNNVKDGLPEFTKYTKEELEYRNAEIAMWDGVSMRYGWHTGIGGFIYWHDKYGLVMTEDITHYAYISPPSEREV